MGIDLIRIGEKSSISKLVHFSFFSVQVATLASSLKAYIYYPTHKGDIHVGDNLVVIWYLLGLSILLFIIQIITCLLPHFIFRKYKSYLLVSNTQAWVLDSSV